MKALKISRILTITITSVMLILIIPFIMINVDNKLGISFKTNDEWLQSILIISNSGTFPIKTNLLKTYKLAIGLLIALGILGLAFGVIAIVTKGKAKTAFTILDAFVLLSAIACAFLKFLLWTNVVFLSLVLGTMAIEILDLVLVVVDDVAMKMKAHIGANTQTQVIYQQNQTNDNDQAINDNLNNSSALLTDSIEIKRHIENLKQNLILESYDDALREIESTGEWKGLDMKDVKEYDYLSELRDKGAELNHNRNGGLESDTLTGITRH